MYKLKKGAFSVKEFYTFLSVARRGGLLSPQKLHTWQETLREFQSFMQSNERDDLRSIDIDSVSERYIEQVNKEQISITPWVIHTRKDLLQNAIGNFVAYVINPHKYCESMRNSTASRLAATPIELTASNPPRAQHSAATSAII